MNSNFKPLHNHGGEKVFKTWDKPTDDAGANKVDEDLIEQQQKCEEIYQKAYQQGLAKAEQEVAQHKQQLNELISLVFNPLRLIDEKLEQEFIKTLIWFCHHCIDIELTQSPEQLNAIFKQIKPHLPLMQQEYQLQLNPQDIEVLQQNLSNENVDFDTNNIVEDSNLHRGEFRLVSATSELDGRFEERLNAIMQSN